MKLYIIIGLILIVSLFIFGCTTGQAVKNTVVCNEPYIQVGTDCCLDQNYNDICDYEEDETTDKLDNNKNIPEIENTNPIWDLTHVDATKYQEAEVSEGYEIKLACTQIITVKVEKVYNDKVVFRFPNENERYPYVSVTVNSGESTLQIENKCGVVFKVVGISPDGKVTVAVGSIDSLGI